MMGAHGPVALLACAVPNLKPAELASNLLVQVFEIDSDGGVGVVFELIVD